MTLRMVSWNLNQREDVWEALVSDERAYHLALVQELGRREPVVDGPVIIPSEGDWGTVGWEKRAFRTGIVDLHPGALRVEPIATHPIGTASADELAVSRPGSLTAARVHLDGETITVVSVYAPWECPVPYHVNGWIYADASAHRLISDISALVDSQRGHRLIVAGDWNVLRGYGEDGSPYWRDRYDTVFARMKALGVPLVGPQLAEGETLDRPEECPPDSRTIPTYRRHRGDPATATRQLDFVFASEALHPRLTVTARCDEDDWGPSDHCRIEILLD